MHHRRFFGFLTSIAGLSVVLPATSTARADSEYSCSIHAWLWIGDQSDDFLLNGNWLNCGLVAGPTTNLNIYFGPVEQFVNGISTGFFFPQGPAVLQSDFSSPLVRLSNGGVDVHLTVRDATYTAPVVVGMPPLNNYPDDSGLATLTLDSAVWNGSISIAEGGGNGCLEILGPSVVTGSITIGSGQAQIKNGGYLLFHQSLDGLAGATTITNRNGAVLELTSVSPFYRPTDDDDEIINEAGATIVKTGAGNTEIGWPITNHGTIEVIEGTTTIPGTVTFGGTGDFFVAADAQLSLHAALLGDNVDVTIEGGGELDITGVSGPATLTLAGPVNLRGSRMNTDVINTGDATLLGAFDGLSAGGDWINAPGSTLRLSTSSPFFRPTNDDDHVVNEAGATIIKTGGGTTEIGWPMTNHGVIQVMEGTTTIPGTVTFGGEGDFVVAAGARLNLHAALLGDNVDVTIEGGGELDITGVSGPATLTLAGPVNLRGSRMNTDVINTGDATLIGAFDGLSAGGEWINAPGSTLRLSTSSPFFRPTNGDDHVVNEAGATIVKTGAGNTEIGWPITNHGTIEVVEGTTTIPGTVTFGGTGDFFVAADTRLNLHAALLGDNVDVTIEGGGELDITGVSGPATLTLHGPVNLRGSRMNTDVINTGDATLLGAFDGLSAGGDWINAPGSTLRLSTSSPFFRPTNGDDHVVNEAGATIIKTGGGTTEIEWAFTNRGTLLIDEGVLQISESQPKFKAETSVITGRGVLRIQNAPAMFNEGVLAPGLADPDTNPAGLTIDVPFLANDDTAVFRVGVGSASGKLTCTGVYDVAGTIEVQRIGDFEPGATEVFTVLEADFVSGVFGDYYDNAVPGFGSDTAINVRTGDLQFDVTYTPTAIIISNVEVVVPPCNDADMAEPSGELDFFDVQTFLALFSAADPGADLNDDGVLDFFDASTFLNLYSAGCP